MEERRAGAERPGPRPRRAAHERRRAGRARRRARRRRPPRPGDDQERERAAGPDRQAQERRPPDIISHALTNGEIVFEGTSISTVTLGDLATRLRGAGTVREIVFLGCTVGNDPSGLNDMKPALGSVSAEGSTCHHVATRIDPPTFSGAPVDSESRFQALGPEEKKLYARGLRQRARENRGDCITGLKPGQKLASVSDEDLRAIARRNRGVLVAEFTDEDKTC